MRRLLLPPFALGLTLLASPVGAQTAPASAPVAAPKSSTVSTTAQQAPPRLIVAISVDQFAADLFAQYRQHYTQGLARLTQGAVFPSAFQSHAATETCPGHATLLTGTHPARNGIIANNWFDLSLSRADKRVYCSEDVADPASTSRDPVVSPQYLKVPTLGELIKRAAPTSRNVAVSAKDRAVMMMGGHDIDAAYWWKGSGFVTLKGRQTHAAVGKLNTALSTLLAKGAPALAAPAWCGARDRAVAVGRGSVGTGRFVLERGKPDAFRYSPRMDAATADLAMALVDEMKLGKAATTDVLSVSFSATDYIGHAVGNEGMEMCIQMNELDRTIGRLLAHLDKRGLDYVVMLSADHGGLDTPERGAEQALPDALRADRALLPAALGAVVAQRTGIKPAQGPLLYADSPFGDYYVNRSLDAAQKARVVADLVAVAKAHPQVAAAFTATELVKAPMPAGNPQDWTLLHRARASFDANRSGDVVVLLDRAVTPIPEPAVGTYIATHGSAWDYDRRVPLLFWRKGMAGFEQPAPVETVDIAPTLAALIGLKVAEGSFDGRCLDLDSGPGNTCGAAK